jgi:hypothetical protein
LRLKRKLLQRQKKAILDAKKRVANVDWRILIDSVEKSKDECIESSIYTRESQLTSCQKVQQAFQDIVNFAGPEIKACWTSAMTGVTEAKALSNTNNITLSELKSASISRAKIISAFEDVAKSCANPIIK